MLLLRFSSNVTPRTFFVTATSRTADVTMSATCLPLCSFDRVELRYGTKNDGKEQLGGRHGEEQLGGRHGEENRGRGALSHPGLGRLLGADSRGLAGQAARRVLSPADRFRRDAPFCDGQGRRGAGG